MIYVPGDNEWTDCHRRNNGGYDNLERLAFLRHTMFAETDSFGRRRLRLEHQGPPDGAYVENTRWKHGDVVFVGLNVPGSNNNKTSPADCPNPNNSARTQAQCDADNVEYAARDAANIDKPLVDQAHLLANLTRAQTFGSPNVHWIRVTVDPRSRNLFTFEPMIVPGN